MWKPQVRYLTCADPENFLEGGGGSPSDQGGTKCSSLNYYIFLRNLTDSPFCRCGSIENTEHYLLQCRLYQQPRVEMPNSVSQLCHVTLDVLLSGDSSFSIDIKLNIFNCAEIY